MNAEEAMDPSAHISKIGFPVGPLSLSKKKMNSRVKNHIRTFDFDGGADDRSVIFGSPQTSDLRDRRFWIHLSLQGRGLDAEYGIGEVHVQRQIAWPANPFMCLSTVSRTLRFQIVVRRAKAQRKAGYLSLCSHGFLKSNDFSERGFW